MKATSPLSSLSRLLVFGPKFPQPKRVGTMTGAGGTAVQLDKSKTPAGSRHPNPCFWHGTFLDRLLSSMACPGKPEAAELGQRTGGFRAIRVWLAAVIFTRRGNIGHPYTQTTVDCHSQGEQALALRRLAQYRET